MTMLSKDEVARHISQVFCLERLAAGDMHMARSLLSALVQVRLCRKCAWLEIQNYANACRMLLQACEGFNLLSSVTPDWQASLISFSQIADKRVL